MSSWIKEVPIEQLVEGESYFLAKKWENHMGPSYLFYSRLLSGKKAMSCKPGIAIRCIANDDLRKILRERTDYVAIAIPADADKRWTARKRRS